MEIPPLGVLRRNSIREVASLLLFFGSLVTRSDLHSAADTAVSELKGRGYTFHADPVRVYPLSSGGEDKISFHQAGVWKPGIIRIRYENIDGTSASVFLRHELQHEANFRTCPPMPLWAQEASAIAFSGERIEGSPDALSVERLKKAIAIDAPLDNKNYATLVSLVTLYGWPSAPCKISEELSKILNEEKSLRNQTFSYVVMHAISGRVLESQGSISEQLPVGSLLKIPFAAALNRKDNEEVKNSLLRSDTNYFEVAGKDLDKDSFRNFYSAAGAKSVEKINELFAVKDFRALLGERDAAKNYPLSFSLNQFALIGRASLLTSLEQLSGLKENGVAKGSTLEAVPRSSINALQSIDALAKTGTVSNEQGEPLLGYLFLAWPAQSPRYIAVIRKGGVRGAALAQIIEPQVLKWKKVFSHQNSLVRVRLLTLLKRDDYSIEFSCEKVTMKNDAITSVCSDIVLATNAPGAKPKRVVHGIIENPKAAPVLLTDPDTYADGVIASEADTLRGESEKSLRSVIMWNGIHGSHRHPDTRSLCDTTHCMVYQGDPVRTRASAPNSTKLLDLLTQIADTRKMPWFLFSAGGENIWEQKLSTAQMNAAMKEDKVISIQRIRSRTGEVSFHLVYGDSEETVSCEPFRVALSLPSCPQSVELKGSDWMIQGQGVGHSQGLDVNRARKLSEEGQSAAQILKDAYDR